MYLSQLVMFLSFLTVCQNEPAKAAKTVKAFSHKATADQNVPIKRLKAALLPRLKENHFVLRLTNEDREKVLVNKFWWFYSVELYDKTGKKLTDSGNYLVGEDLLLPDEEGWVLLETGETIEFPIRVYSKTARIPVPRTAYRVECNYLKPLVERTDMPAHFADRKIKVAHMPDQLIYHFTKQGTLSFQSANNHLSEGLALWKAKHGQHPTVPSGGTSP